MKPCDKPVISKYKRKPPRAISSDETPCHLRNLMDISRYIGQECGEQSYNEMAKVFNVQLKKTQITVQDALNLMTTCLTYLNATWLFFMKKIADGDDSGIEVEDILEAIKMGSAKLVSTGELVDI